MVDHHLYVLVLFNYSGNHILLKLAVGLSSHSQHRRQAATANTANCINGEQAVLGNFVWPNLQEPAELINYILRAFKIASCPQANGNFVLAWLGCFEKMVKRDNPIYSG